MKGYALTAQAEADLEEIADYLLERNPAAAMRLIADLESAFDRVAAFPASAPERKDRTQRPVRFLTVRGYIVVYRPDARPIEIQRVLHGARNADALL